MCQKKSFWCRSIIQKKEFWKKYSLRKTWYFLCIPFFCVCYKQEIIEYKLCGIRLKRSPMKKTKVSVPINSGSFHPLISDDTALLDVLKKLGSFVYIPNPGNMGDLLIAAATVLFFEKHHLDYKMYEQPEDCHGKAIVYGGGGIWVPYYKTAWMETMTLFHQAKQIVVLPSSFYQCDEFIQQLDNRYTLFCRDNVSYEYVRQMKTPARVILDHDMAFRMSPDIFKSDILYSSYDYQLLSQMNDALKKMPAVAKFLRKDCEQKYNFDGDFDLSACLKGTKTSSIPYILSSAKIMLSIISQFDVIVTDRLHVGIAGVLMQKKVCWLDNSYHKISNVYRHSIPDCPFVSLCDHIVMPKTYHKTSTDYFNRIMKSLEQVHKNDNLS